MTIFFISVYDTGSVCRRRAVSQNSCGVCRSSTYCGAGCTDDIHSTTTPLHFWIIRAVATVVPTFAGNFEIPLTLWLREVNKENGSAAGAS